MRVLIWANDAGTKVLIFFTGGRLEDLLPLVALDEGRELQFFPSTDISDIVVRCDGATLTGRPFGRVAASIGLDDERLLCCVWSYLSYIFNRMVQGQRFQAITRVTCDQSICCGHARTQASPSHRQGVHVYALHWVTLSHLL